MQNKANLHKAQMGTSRYEQKDCEEKSRRDVRKKQSQFMYQKLSSLFIIKTESKKLPRRHEVTKLKLNIL